jgi:hypothetical protein
MKIGGCEGESSGAGSAEAEGNIPSAQIPITFNLGISVGRIRRNGGNRRSRAVLVSFDGAGNQNLVASMFEALGIQILAILVNPSFWRQSVFDKRLK